MAGARNVGKLAIVVNFAVEQICGFKPRSPKDLHDHATAISEKLRSKGYGGKAGVPLPSYLENCLIRLLKKAADMSAAAAAAPAQTETPTAAKATAAAGEPAKHVKGTS